MISSKTPAFFRSGLLFNALVAVSLVGINTASYADGIEYTGPLSRAGGAAQVQTDFAKYCKGTAISTATASPNYSNALVKAAAAQLSKVADISFYFYSPIVKAYSLYAPPVAGAPAGTKKSLIAAGADAPAGTTPYANAFLTMLCGEFRDRPSMIASKLGWAKNIQILPVSDQGPIDPAKPLWPQVSAKSYSPYLQVSSAYYYAKMGELNNGTVALGADAPTHATDGTTVCEVKYMFSEYVAKSKAFDDLATFRTGLEAFKPKCAAGDNDYYYDFRGDSNYKPQSPESNGMIWYTTTIASLCETTSKAVAGAKITDADCQNYFSHPFSSRWNANRAGLAAWLMRGTQHDARFADHGAGTFTIVPNLNSKTQPLSFLRDDQTTISDASDFDPAFFTPSHFAAGDLGLNDMIAAHDLGYGYERIRDALNRHTDWYTSGWNPTSLGADPKQVKTQAYSPFVASSYEMSASDGFTQPGATVSSPSDGRKQWMFVFKIKKENWMNTDKLAAGGKPDFDRMWFDETSFGTAGYAKSERAWDRLGTALEGEMDSILYLHNIDTSGQAVTQ